VVSNPVRDASSSTMRPAAAGVRVDSHAYSKYLIPPNYDSMIAKLITLGSTRASSIARMSRALGEYLIEGVATTIPFQQMIMRNADFRKGEYDTGFVDRLLRQGGAKIVSLPLRQCHEKRCKIATSTASSTSVM